jgi:hypothetical protein
VKAKLLGALVIAAIVALTRLVTDALIRPHLTWWLTAAVAFLASLTTSALWYPLYRYPSSSDSRQRPPTSGEEETPSMEPRAAQLVQNLRDLERSLREHPAEWPDDLLAEVDGLAARTKGLAATERLGRALGQPRQ